MGGRQRVHGVKREHSVIKGLLPILERIGAHPAVSAVIPGRIAVTRGHCRTLELRFGVETPSGFKLNARRASTLQEVFVVSNTPEVVRAFLRQELPEYAE